MKPMESMSQTLAKLLQEREKFEEVIKYLNQLLEGDK